MPRKQPSLPHHTHMVSMYDGDTLRADVDQGLVTLDRLRELMLGRDIMIETEKKGTFGRYHRPGSSAKKPMGRSLT